MLSPGSCHVKCLGLLLYKQTAEAWARPKEMGLQTAPPSSIPSIPAFSCWQIRLPHVGCSKHSHFSASTKEVVACPVQIVGSCFERRTQFIYEQQISFAEDISVVKMTQQNMHCVFTLSPSCGIIYSQTPSSYSL